MKKIIVGFLAIFWLFNISIAQEQPQAELVFLIKTDMGSIKVKLYNETPGHRDNFLKLVSSGFYNGSIFHRVINQFMIQGGGAANGTEDAGYTIPAEFVATFFHKKGVLAAARMPDNLNPTKASSGSQFYIVQGRVFSDQELDALEIRKGRKFTAQQREIYKTIGGTPHLDGDYTVFGEVIEGLDVIDKIAAVQTDPNNKPLKDIKMTIEQVK